jgi:uncharacterized protein YbjT (DUF2867 family)
MLSVFVLCFCVVLAVVTSSITRVAVTGGAGRTGSIVFKKLLERTNEFEPVALVRTEKSRRALIKQSGAKPEQVVVCDVSNESSVKQALVGADKLVLCTSAVPQILPLSIIKLMVGKLFKKTGRPEFKFRKGGSPYHVDWLGAKAQVDAAKASGVKQVVVVGSMGGTDPSNFLNTIGRKEDDVLSGNILQWKRKAEWYLTNSGLPYTIIHPGGLLDKAGGEREIVFGVDDELLKEKTRSIPRADVAEVCVQSLLSPLALNRAFDVISREPAGGAGGKDAPAPQPFKHDWQRWFEASGGRNCHY